MHPPRAESLRQREYDAASGVISRVVSPAHSRRPFCGTGEGVSPAAPGSTSPYPPGHTRSDVHRLTGFEVRVDVSPAGWPAVSLRLSRSNPPTGRPTHSNSWIGSNADGLTRGLSPCGVAPDKIRAGLFSWKRGERLHTDCSRGYQAAKNTNLKPAATVFPSAWQTASRKKRLIPRLNARHASNRVAFCEFGENSEQLFGEMLACHWNPCEKSHKADLLNWLHIQIS